MEGGSPGPDTGAQEQTEEEAGKIWGKGTHDRDLGWKTMRHQKRTVSHRESDMQRVGGSRLGRWRI